MYAAVLKGAAIYESSDKGMFFVLPRKARFPAFGK
jgi:hypothetical protein